MTRSSLYDERFGDLRSLLGQKPSALGFARQCRAIEQMWELEPARVNQELVPYMERALEAWPDALRAHPIFWLRHWYPAAAAAVDFEPVRLVRVLNLEQQRLGAALIARMAELEAWHGVLSLNLAGNLLDAEAVAALTRIPFKGLRHLNLSQNPVEEDGLWALLYAPWIEGLRELELWATGCQFSDAVTLKLPDLIGSLERLSLSAAEFSALGQRMIKVRWRERVVFS